MDYSKKIGIVIPIANEADTFYQFIARLKKTIDRLDKVKVYLILDNASKDNSLQLSKDLEKEDKRFITVFAPQNTNVVDAYLRGYSEAYKMGNDWIVEMDAGLSHEPEEILTFLEFLDKGYDCVYGSRFIEGGKMLNCSFKRKILSKYGTYFSNVLLGTDYHDMTSGFQGFKSDVVKKLLDYKLKSKAHFFQTEVKYLLRNFKFVEIPITYSSPSPRVSTKSILNSIHVLCYYFKERLLARSKQIQKYDA